MIPEEKSAAVAHALRETFGVPDFEDIRRITKGLSSDLVFRIVVGEAPYLLRVMARIDERMDPNRIFACMSAASQARLTPRLRYSNAKEGISITDFVEAVPLERTEALVQLPGMLQRLHSLAPFPKEFNYETAHKGFIWRFRKANLLPNHEVEEAFHRYGQICAIYPRLAPDMVSCHLDLKPENILFDGKQLWLVDWQAGFVNDRYFDLAVAANFLLTDDADEVTYLERYFDQQPDENQRARFFLMRQVVHIFYATVFLLLGSAGKPIDKNCGVPSFKEFHGRLWAGELDMTDNDLKIVYGMVHWERLLQNIRQARFEESLRIVSSCHTSAEGMRRLLPVGQ